ncbi:hypothetical protein HK096_008981 [Nowakowskiella sp. JEL0078]|nr:hypothetical protein HK096_008981 [Nowakowskiella sp. JEL0078]
MESLSTVDNSSSFVGDFVDTSASSSDITSIIDILDVNQNELLNGSTSALPSTSVLVSQ